ncbi:MAG: cytochrome c3 family protein, partial [Halioglobus sp.]|nr:cytochrome c3 family protein [Halioglobus sp.]
MAKVLLRQVFRQGDARTLHDLELDTREISIGSASENTLTLSGAGMLPRHARIKLGRRPSVRSLDGGALQVNGEDRRKCRLSPGDRIGLGGNLLTLLDPPPGFDFALMVEQEAGAAARASEFTQPAVSDGVPWSLPRSLLWTVVVTLVLAFLAPGLARYLERAEEEAAGTRLEALWSTGPLHPAHQAAAGDDCATCHGGAFARIDDSACRSCHDTTGAHARPAVLAHREQEEGACKGCHEEHQGQDQLVDTQGFACAGCHETGRLGAGHPAFTDYPRPQRPQIIFDHQAHL